LTGCDRIPKEAWRFGFQGLSQGLKGIKGILGPFSRRLISLKKKIDNMMNKILKMIPNGGTKRVLCFQKRRF